MMLNEVTTDVSIIICICACARMATRSISSRVMRLSSSRSAGLGERTVRCDDDIAVGAACAIEQTLQATPTAIVSVFLLTYLVLSIRSPLERHVHASCL